MNVTERFGKILFKPGAAAAVRALIDAGHDIEAADNADGWTVLHYALVPVASRPDIEVVKVLLASGSAPNRPDRHGWTPLHFAARAGVPEVIACLLSAGADPNLEDDKGITPLHRYLIKPSPRARGDSPRDTEIVRWLLERGARVTPKLEAFLRAVVFTNKTEVLDLLAL